MVYAANGATVVDGLVYSAKFRYPQRQPEGPAYQKWFADAGFVTHTAAEVNEGEGDILIVGDVLLAGTGFRTDRAAHRELAELTGHEVVSLELVDPRYYHLDTALAVLDADPAHPLIAYYPPAFSPASQAAARRALPGRRPRDRARRRALGLNAVSDGCTWSSPPRRWTSPPSCGTAASSRSRSTPASCSRAAAAPSAARSRSGT